MKPALRNGLVIGVVLFFLVFFAAQTSFFVKSPVPQTAPEILSGSVNHEETAHQQYLSFLKEVYETMSANYYLPVKQQDYDSFIAKFERSIYPQVADKNTVSNYIKWRSTAYLVENLAAPEDTFSAFFPPQAAHNFEKKVLGKKVDLGIDGILTEQGFEVARVEPRSDAYIEGLRQSDIIQTIDEISVQLLTEEEIIAKLTPSVDEIVLVSYIDAETKEETFIEIESREYFKQSVFMVPVEEPGVFCLEIQAFNRKTSEDMFRFLKKISETGSIGLILDLRDNPGGPPLAAREISSFFLTPNQEMAYFQKKGQPKAMLTVPEIPEEYRYKGSIVVLVNSQSGSASELFSGALQRYNRAVLMGTNTAGQVLLKSMFNFDDDSMLLLVTSRGYFADGTPYSFAGITPDKILEEEGIDLIKVAARYLVEQNEAQN